MRTPEAWQKGRGSPQTTCSVVVDLAVGGTKLPDDNDVADDVVDDKEKNSTYEMIKELVSNWELEDAAIVRTVRFMKKGI